MGFFETLIDATPDIRVDITDTHVKIHGFLFSNNAIAKNICKLDRFAYMYTKRNMLYFETFRFFLPEVKLLLETMIGLKNKYGVHVPRCTEALRQINEFEEQESVKLKNKIDLKLIEKTMTFKIASHQEDAINNYLLYKSRLGLRGLLLDADPGTGKTFMSLALITGLKLDRVVIICPLPTVDNVWVKSLSSPGDRVFKDIQPHYNIRDKSINFKNEKFIISHYEGLEHLDTFLKSKKYFKGEKVAVIVDESHNFNENKSKRFQLLTKIINTLDPEDVFLLSGTPIKGTFSELLNVFCLLDKNFQGNILTRFTKFYKSAGSPISEWLTERYRKNSVKVKKASLGLEPVITSYVKIKLPTKLADKFLLTTIRDNVVEYVKNRMAEIKQNDDKYVKLYSDYLDDGFKKLIDRKEITNKEINTYKDYANFIRKNPDKLAFHNDKLKYCNQIEAKIVSVLETKEERDEFKEVKVIYKYAHLKAQGEALGRIVTGARIECHRELAKAVRYDPIINSTIKKTLIFSNYVGVCEASVKTLKALKYKPLEVFGEHVKNLPATVEKFKTTKQNPLVATYQSLGTGVPLIAANVVICLDLPFRQYLYDQAISRVWRLGQDQQVYVYIINLDTGEDPNINTRNVDIIKYFKEEVERLLGYKSAIDLAETEVLSMEAMSFVRDARAADLVISKNKYNFATKTFSIFRRWSEK